MCGRYSLTASPDEVRELFEYLEQPNFPPRYNIAPTQPIAVVRRGPAGRQFALVRWGLIPSWVKDPQSFTLLINARSETAAAKPSFRSAFKRRRCLVPASGFYEWQRRSGSKKQPYWVRPRHGGPIGFAGLWETWMGADGSEMDSAAILTTEANAAIRHIHHRMPVVIQPQDFARWLDTNETEAGDLSDLLTAPDDDFFEAIPVSSRVNAVRNDDADNQEPVDMADEEGGEAKDRPAKAPDKKPDSDDGQMSLL